MAISDGEIQGNVRQFPGWSCRMKISRIGTMQRLPMTKVDFHVDCLPFGKEPWNMYNFMLGSIPCGCQLKIKYSKT